MREYQPHIKKRLLSMINPPLLEEIENMPSPEIAMHVRLSDFRAPSPGEDVDNLFNLRTPIDWYVQSLIQVREIAGYDIPVTVFSDGYDHELRELFQLPNVVRSPDAPALIDMILMSRSKFLIASAKSSFSAWASYLGQCPTVWHPTHSFTHCFSDSATKSVFEGSFDPYKPKEQLPELLIDNISAIFASYSSNYSSTRR